MKTNISRRNFLGGVCAVGTTAAAAGSNEARTTTEPSVRSSEPKPMNGGPTKLILRTYSSDENYNGDCDFAYIEIDRERARRILERMDLLHETYCRDRELFKMHFWDWVDFFHYSNSEDDESGEIPEGFEERLPDSLLDEDAWTIMDPEFELPERLSERTECNFLVVCEFGTKDRPNQEIEWQCYPKHTDVRITTTTLSRKLIEQIARS